MSEATRAWFYRISLALLVVAGVYGFVSEEQAVAWGGLALAIANSGLATLNTSTSSDG
jgi:hypothetical protein